MARKKRWVEHDVVDGCGEVYLYSWRYFFDYVHQEMLDYQTYIWRGKRCDNWLLEPTLDRLVKRAKIAPRKDIRFANHILNNLNTQPEVDEVPTPLV